MTAAELQEWEIDYELSPWGERRKDLRAGVVAQACMAPHMRKGQRPPDPESFVMFSDGRQHVGQTMEEQKAVVERINRRHREAQERRRQREAE